MTMSDVLQGAQGTITADEIRVRADLLPHTRTLPRPRLAHSNTLRTKLRWVEREAKVWSVEFSVGPVDCYWASGDAKGDFGWYYQQHCAAALVQVRGLNAGAVVTGEWGLYGLFGGVAAPLDVSSFTLPNQPLVTNRAWVSPEVAYARLTLRTVDEPPLNTFIVLQWALIVSNPIR